MHYLPKRLAETGCAHINYAGQIINTNDLVQIAANVIDGLGDLMIGSK